MKKRLSWVRDFARERRFSIGRGGWEWGRPGVWGWNPQPDTAKHAEARYVEEPASAGDGIPSLTQPNTLKRVTSGSPPRLGMESPA